jgi:SAM-dependent methyltransferase
MESPVSANCPLCASDDAVPAFEKNGYSLFECGECMSIFVYPRPSSEEIKTFYRRQGGDTMSSVCWSDAPDSHRHSWGTWSRLLDFAEKLAGRGPLLDVGCGTGQFLDFARAQGWEPRFGVELSPEAARRARQLTGSNIVVADLTKNPMPQNYFAAVVLWDILEHVPNVRGLLSEIRGLLRPGGVALIGTVHRNGISMRLLKERALTVAPPEHLTFSTHTGLTRAAFGCGLSVSACWSSTLYLREWAPLIPRFGGTRRNQHCDYAAFRTRLSRSRAFGLVAASADAILKATRLGDELIAVARRSTTHGAR